MSQDPYLTPTFGMILNRNLLWLTEARNRKDYAEAYDILKTVVDMLKPEHHDKIFNNGIQQTEKELASVSGLKSVDLYNTRRLKNHETAKILHRRLPQLFRDLMILLHEGNYLEKSPVRPRYQKTKPLRVE